MLGAVKLEPNEDLRLWGYAPGCYLFRCRDCKPVTSVADYPTGDKRSWRCVEHARATRDAQ